MGKKIKGLAKKAEKKERKAELRESRRQGEPWGQKKRVERAFVFFAIKKGKKEHRKQKKERRFLVGCRFKAPVLVFLFFFVVVCFWCSKLYTHCNHVRFFLINEKFVR